MSSRFAEFKEDGANVPMTGEGYKFRRELVQESNERTWRIKSFLNRYSMKEFARYYALDENGDSKHELLIVPDKQYFKFPANRVRLIYNHKVDEDEVEFTSVRDYTFNRSTRGIGVKAGIVLINHGDIAAKALQAQDLPPYVFEPYQGRADYLEGLKYRPPIPESPTPGTEINTLKQEVQLSQDLLDLLLMMVSRDSKEIAWPL